MEASAVAVEQKYDRKIFVCLENGCSRCPISKTDIPEDCEFRILQALDNSQGGIQHMPRQSGKTTKIVAMANRIAKAGYPTYLVTISHDMALRIKRQYGLHQDVIVSSDKSAMTHFRGLAPGYVLFDEVLEDTARSIMRMMKGSVLVAVYFTPRLA